MSNVHSIARETGEKLRFKLTDSGNAERFAHQHGDKARYVRDWKTWLTWDGKRWSRDDLGAVSLLVKQTVRAIDKDLTKESDDTARTAIRKHAIKSECRQGRENMLALAQSELSTRPGNFNLDPWLLNVVNGTLDLRTGKLRPHAREDMITKLAPVAYDPNASAPLWDAFLSRAMGGSAPMVSYLQRLAGYSLTGSTREQMLAFSYGDGRNGKGVFHHTLAKVLGDYADTAANHLFFVSKGDGGHPTSMASLAGARFVLCSEIPKDKAFNEELLKFATGNDKIKTRRMHENEFEYTPEFKLFFCGNHKPQIKGLDYAIWSRIKLIPWNVVIPPSEIDTDLETKLQADLPGILAWAVRGCADWQKHRLGEPPDVQQATAQYKEESDPLSEFFRARCDFGGEFRVSRVGLRREYEMWCTRQGAKPFGPRTVGESLRRRGVVDGGSIRDNGIPVNAWSGVRIRDDA
jgi:putative DNA primase/helicase